MKDISLLLKKSESIEVNNDELVCVTSNKDVAIIGMAATFPEAEDVGEFWNNLAFGKDCTRVFPEKRKVDIDQYLSYIGVPKRKIKYMDASYLEEIDKFDYRFFRLTPKEASLMNPNQRLFLETAWEAIEDAGYGGHRLIGSKTGVFVGYIGDFDGCKYRQIISDVDESSSAVSIIGNLPSIIPSRISYLLDLKGPAMLIDTACSSSLVAVHTACKAIRNGECELALAGGVKTCIIPLDSQEKIGMESSDGKTRPFDDSADGTGMGEGVAAVLLKPLSKALKDGDNIYAVIKGTATNQDGNSIGITAPNVKAQSDVIVKAWKDADINPETISYIEAHGTGTKLGDPIEIAGIKMAFERYTDKKQVCGIGSVKSNIGHLYDCAGIASLIKVVLAMKHSQIPPSINFVIPNKTIDFEDSPVYVNDKLKNWYSIGTPLRAGISAFGFSGTNCHIVIEEAPSKLVKFKKDSSLNIFTISAKTKQALKDLISKYKTFFARIEDLNLKDICYTASTGRGHYNYRIAIISNDMFDLKEKLNYLDDINADYEVNIEHDSNIFYGEHDIKCLNNGAEDKLEIIETKANELGQRAELLIDEFLKNKASLATLKEICQLYIKGADIRWRKFYHNEKRNKISLPTYPFERQRCWIEIPYAEHKNPYMNELACLFNEDNLPKDFLEEIEALIKKHEIQLGAIVENRENSPESGYVIIHGHKENEKYSDMERLVAQVWSDELGFKEVNIFDSFYELGGDSILATKIANSLNQKLERQISIADVLKHRTVYDFAKYLADNQSQNTVSCYKIQSAGHRDCYPTSSAQKRLYILSQLKDAGISYNMPFTMIFDGNVDIKSFENVFKEVVRIHEAFRTSFHLHNEEPIQKINTDVEFVVCYKELNLSDVQMFINDFVRPFDLSEAPLLRVALLKVDKFKHVLVIDMHHIISDGTSMGILLGNFACLYRGMKLNKPSLQYKDFAVWQKEFQASEYVKSQEKYWLDLFASNLPVLNMPIDYQRPQIQSFEGDVVKFTLDTELTFNILTFCRETETTLFILLLSAYFILLSKYSGQEDIIVGSPIAGRPNSDLEDVVGMFVNMLALRNYPSMHKSYHEFLYEVKYNALKAYENQDYQFDELVDKLITTRNPSRNPIFDTVFVLQNMDLPDIEINGLKLMPFNENTKSKFDITFEAIEKNGVINFSVEYCIKLFKRTTIEKFARDYTNILKIILKNPNIKLKEIEIDHDFKLLENADLHEVEFDF